MFNRRNAFIGWAVLQVVKRKLRKQGAHAGAGSGVVRKLRRLGTGAALAGAIAVVARKLRRRGGAAPS